MSTSWARTQEVTVHLIRTRLWYSTDINNKILWAVYIDYDSLWFQAVWEPNCGNWWTVQYSCLFIQCNSLYMGEAPTRIQWSLWDIVHFQFFWAQVLSQTSQGNHSLNWSQWLVNWPISIIWDYENIPHWATWMEKISQSNHEYSSEMSPTCMVVLIANGSWLSGVFRMLISAIETKTFCASRTFLSSSIT